jgi:hypothetical protein
MVARWWRSASHMTQDLRLQIREISSLTRRWMLSRLLLRPLSVNTPRPHLRRFTNRTALGMSTPADTTPPKELTANIEGEGAAQTKSAGESFVVMIFADGADSFYSKERGEAIRKGGQVCCQNIQDSRSSSNLCPRKREEEARKGDQSRGGTICEYNSSWPEKRSVASFLIGFKSHSRAGRSFTTNGRGV